MPCRLFVETSLIATLAAAAVSCLPEPPHVERHAPVGSTDIVGQTATLCSLLGPNTNRPGIYGTDLGISVKLPHVEGSPDQLGMLFGDTWVEATTSCTYPSATSDDLQATLPAQRPAAIDDPQPSAAACADLQYPVDDTTDPTTWRRLRLYRDASQRDEANLINTGALRTPVTAFSDGAHVFGVFVRDEPAVCSSSSECPASMVCSADPSYTGKKLGACSPHVALTSDAEPAYCLSDADCPPLSKCDDIDQGACLAQAPFVVTRAGQQLSPSWYQDDPRRGIALTMRIASAFWPDRPQDYATGFRFVTNKFINVTARTVRHFDLEHPEQNDYTPGNETLLLWGRAAFFTTKGWQALLFLMSQPLANLLDTDGTIHWSPHFFAGYDANGQPQWSDAEADAQPLYGVDENLERSGDAFSWQWRQPEFDHVNQMSITWFAPLQRWVMVYGGDAAEFSIVDPASGKPLDPAFPQSLPGAIYVRSAAHPWGRSIADAANAEGWSSARPLLTRQAMKKYLACDDDVKTTAECNPDPDQRHPSDLLSTIAGVALATKLSPDDWLSVTAKCVAGDAALGLQNSLADDGSGHLYGSNVIEEWTRDVSAQTAGLAEGDAAVEFVWNVSTWNPYQVMLLKTTLRSGDLR